MQLYKVVYARRYINFLVLKFNASKATQCKLLTHSL